MKLFMFRPWNRKGSRYFPYQSLLFPTLFTLATSILNFFLRKMAIHHPVSKWPTILDPQSLVLLISLLAMWPMTTGFVAAVSIRFRVTYYHGTNMTDLHYVWASSASCWDAVRALAAGKAVLSALSTLVFYLCSLILPVLWSRSFYQGDVTIPFNGTADLHITPNAMSDLFGTKFSFAHPAMVAYRDMLAREPIRFAENVCDNCTMVVPAFGWAMTCSVSAGADFDFGVVPELPPAKPLNLFAINITDRLGPKGYEIGIITTYKSSTSCTGKFVTQECALARSVVSYRLDVQGSTTKYERGNTLNVPEDYHVPFVAGPGVSMMQLPLPPNQPSLFPYDDERLAQFTKIGQSLYNTTFAATPSKRWWGLDDDTMDPGSIFRSWVAAGYLQELPNAQHEVPSLCKIGFNSPMDDILHTYHELALRVSVLAAIDGNTTQSVPYFGEKIRRDYLDDKTWARAAFGGAIATTVLVVLASLGMHWGWWLFDGGADLTMSPVEIARIFAAEVMRERGWVVPEGAERATEAESGGGVTDEAENENV